MGRKHELEYMRYRTLIIIALLFLAPPFHGRAADGVEVSVVLTSASGPYLEAFSAFREEYGAPVRTYDLSSSRELPRSGIVVTFGGRAGAPGAYPRSVRLIRCLAPGAKAYASSGDVVISMVPEPESALRGISQIQPGIKKLVVFATHSSFGEYFDALAAAGKRSGMQVIAAKVGAADDIPGELRRLLSGMDAFWLLPDPQLISASVFVTLRDFSRANRIPFYAPTAGLAEKGATAAVYSGFSEMGRAAARAAKGGAVSGIVYPEKTSYALNIAESAYIGLKIPPAAVRAAEELFQ